MTKETSSLWIVDVEAQIHPHVLRHGTSQLVGARNRRDTPERRGPSGFCREDKNAMAKQARFEIRRGPTGLFRFVLIAANGEPLATSEHYKTRAGCKKGIDATIAAFNGYYGDPVVVDTTTETAPNRKRP